MRVSIGKISGGNQQFAETINNSGPVAVEVRQVREQFTRLVDRGDLPVGVAEAMEVEIEKAEDEAGATKPRRGRLAEALARVGVLASGITAATELARSVDAAAQTISAIQ